MGGHPPWAVFQVLSTFVTRLVPTHRYPEIVETCAQQAHELAEGETACDNLYIDL